MVASASAYFLVAELDHRQVVHGGEVVVVVQTVGFHRLRVKYSAARTDHPVRRRIAGERIGEGLLVRAAEGNIAAIASALAMTLSFSCFEQLLHLLQLLDDFAGSPWPRAARGSRSDTAPRLPPSSARHPCSCRVPPSAWRAVRACWWCRTAAGHWPTGQDHQPERTAQGRDEGTTDRLVHATPRMGTIAANNRRGDAPQQKVRRFDRAGILSVPPC